MNEYAVGDLVEAVKGETVVRGRVTVNPIGIAAIECQPGLTWMEENGFTITVIEKAAPKLPSEAGIYSDHMGSTWRLDGFDGWCRLYDGAECAADHAPFTRLEPVPDTAKKVIEALGEYLDGQLTGRTKGDIIAAMAEEFGVTS